MAEALPIACSLSATDFRQRLHAIADLGRDALLSSRIDGTHGTLRFAAGVGIRERVEAVAEAESKCCAFLNITVSKEADIVVLSVHAPEGADLELAEFVGAFDADAAADGTVLHGGLAP